MTRSPAPAGAEARPVVPGPDHRDLYLLVAGILLGIVLGPAVLGRLSPAAYEGLFVGREVQARQQALDEALGEAAELRLRLAASGVSPAALTELEQRDGPRLLALEAELTRARQRQAGRATALVLAVLVVMVIETLAAPGALRVRARLATARYALLALWVALLLAQPGLLRATPLAFVAGLVAVALLAALIPLRPRPATPGA